MSKKKKEYLPPEYDENSELVIFGDGSADNDKERNPDGIGGIGCLLLYKGRRKEISESFDNDETNNSMEIMAIIRGLENIKTTNIPIKVFSDSSYLINCFKDKWYVKWRSNGWKNSKGKPVENRELWERLLTLVEKQEEINFNHVKGHASFWENELCDKLAKQAVEEYRKRNEQP